VKRIVTFVFFATLMFALSMQAGAATLSLTSGATVGSPLSGFIPTGAPNTFLGPGNLFPGLLIVSGYYGATINYSIPGTNGSVTIDFFGGEAGFSDQFLYDSGAGYVMPPGFDHPGVPTVALAPNLASPLATFTAPLSGSGVLPFEFRVNGLTGGLVVAAGRAKAAGGGA